MKLESSTGPIARILCICLVFSCFVLQPVLWGNQANHTVFLTESDVVMGTGKNDYGQLSVPVVTQSSVPIQSNFGVREVASGWYHTLFLMWDGTVWAVGKNSDGQLGDGTTINRSTPVQVVDRSGNPLGGVTAMFFAPFLPGLEPKPDTIDGDNKKNVFFSSLVLIKSVKSLSI